MNTYEIFHPSTGRPIYRVPYLWMARLLTRNGLDYARRGEGW